MDLQEASLSMALLMKRESDFYNAYIKEINTKNTLTPDERDLLKEYEWIQSSTRELGNRLAANPNFFGVMESWKVYIIGKEGVTRESVLEAHKQDNVEDLLERCGSLAVSVKAYLKDKKHMICDMSAGEDGWDIAIRCTEQLSRTFCQDIYRKFNAAINMELIDLSRRFAGHCLPGLYTWEDAFKFLKIYGG